MEDIPWSGAVTSSEFEKLLGLDAGAVQEFSVKRLTKIGQNFGSTMLSIDLKLQDGGKLHLVGKFMPPTAIQKEIFASVTTFLKEVNVYRYINDELLLLQRERNMKDEELSNPLPRYYGSRVNVADNDLLDADDNAVLLLQNLAVDGYRMVEQMYGFDLTHAKLVVSSLARFQATAVALKVLKPDVFKKIINQCSASDTMGPEKMCEPLLVHITSFKEISPYYDKLKVASDRCRGLTLSQMLSQVVEPYASLSHNDLWVNNMMFRYDSSNSNEPTDVKFFDFQTLSYSSLVRDLIFFLYSSLEYSLIVNCIDDLIAFYYDCFISWLRKLGCDTAMFSEKQFMMEIDRVAPTEIMHILMMLNVICAEEVEKFNVGDLDIEAPPFSSGEMYRKKTKCVVEEFVKRGWL